LTEQGTGLSRRIRWALAAVGLVIGAAAASSVWVSASNRGNFSHAGLHGQRGETPPPPAVVEPASLLLLGGGLAAMATKLRRRKA
jgi:hypothetical protein